MKNIVISGNVGADAELRTTQNGDDVCSFNVAVSDRRRKETLWFTVYYWGKAGKAVSDFIKKGSTVTVSGDFFTKEYNDKTYLNVNAHAVTLGKRIQESSNEGIDQNNEDENDASYEMQDDEIPF